MDKKTTGIVGYITFIGLIIAYCTGDREGAKFHLNQSLVITIAGLILGVVSCILSVVSFIPVLGAIFGVLGTIISVVGEIFLLVCIILGIISAAKDEEKELPLIGKIKILK